MKTEEHPACKNCCGACVVICLERGADDLDIVQLMALPQCHPSSLVSLKYGMVYLSGASLPRLC